MFWHWEVGKEKNLSHFSLYISTAQVRGREKPKRTLNSIFKVAESNPAPYFIH